MKSVLVISFCLVFVFMGQAQIRFGGKAGLNISSFVGKDVEDVKSIAGFHAGGLVQVPIFKLFSLQPEVYISTQGGKAESDEDVERINLTYLQIPVLVKCKSPIGIFAETGPQLGVILKATDKYNGENTNIKSYLKETDFLWVFGAGYEFGMIGFYARYNLGITKIYENARNSVFQGGIYFVLGKSKRK